MKNLDFTKLPGALTFAGMLLRLHSVMGVCGLLLLVSCGARSQSRQMVARPLPAVVVPQTPRSSGGIPSQAPPQVFGESAIVIDAQSGRVLYAKNADEQRPVASTQKLVTALATLDAGSLQKPVKITADDTKCEPTKLYLKPGETYTRAELLKVLMVKSANDVARALARDVAGSQEDFADVMNRKAAQLGMRRSHFVTPNGLPAPGQYSTARDIAIAARHAYRSPAIRSWVEVKEYSFQFPDGRTRKIENTNRLLKRVSYCNGMKTGTTNAAGRCLVASGELNGRTAIVVVLKSTTPHIWNDSEKLLRWALETPRT